MADIRMWHNLFQRRVYVSTFGECIMTAQPLAVGRDTLTDDEMQSVAFYAFKPSDDLKYTLYFNTVNGVEELCDNAWAFVGLAHKFPGISDIVPKGKFDEGHPLSVNNLVVAADKRGKARFNFVKVLEEYGVDVATYINDITSTLMSYYGCRGLYTREFAESKCLTPLSATREEKYELWHKLHLYVHKSALNFSAKAKYTVLNLATCAVTTYTWGSLYQMITTAGGDHNEFQIYGATANFVWLDVDRTLTQGH